MKHDIFIALIALEIGWSMHARLAARFCLRCKARQFFLVMTRYGIEQNSFWKKFVFVSGVQLFGFSTVLEIAQAWGFKRTLAVIKSIMENIRNARSQKR